jgi:hypothetical protein
MAGWLDKASNVFRRTAPEVDHPFAVPCECGLVHRGMRRNRHQKIVCRECGATRFVLPKDVYPAPKDRPREPAPPPTDLPVLNPIKEPPGKRVSKATATVPREEKANPKVTREAAPEFFVVPARRRLVTPFRMVALGITVVAMGTGYFVVQKLRRDRATTDLRDAADSAWAAVEDADWPVARTQFKKAVDAAGILGRQDNASLRLTCGLREVSAIEQLCPKPLQEILAEADSMSSDAEKWRKHFLTHYQDRWLVFDGPVDSRPDGWRVAFPVKVGKRNRPVRVALKSSALDGVKESEAEQGIVLAARLEGCELSKDKKFWDVTFAPESAFLWSLPETFATLGIEGGEFRSSVQTDELLDRQAALNGIEPEVGK